MTFPPPDFNFEVENCPKCSMPVDNSEVMIECPKCFAKHHRRCVNEGVSCGSAECDYVFSWSDDDQTLVFKEFSGDERRDSDRRKADKGAPGGVERRIGPRRSADF